MERSEVSNLRLFTGLALSEEVLDYVSGVIEAIGSEVQGVRWVPLANLHVTLKFLGQCSPDILPDVVEAMGKTRPLLPLELKVGGIGAFPSQSSAKVLWVGAQDPEGRLEKLFRVLDRAVRPCGFAREKRRYRPHITIGRSRRSPARIPEGLSDKFAEELSLRVEEVLLYSSELSSGGASYTVLGRVGAAGH